jgi:hypothetical protein
MCSGSHILFPVNANNKSVVSRRLDTVYVTYDIKLTFEFEIWWQHFDATFIIFLMDDRLTKESGPSVLTSGAGFLLFDSNYLVLIRITELHYCEIQAWNGDRFSYMSMSRLLIRERVMYPDCSYRTESTNHFKANYWEGNLFSLASSPIGILPVEAMDWESFNLSHDDKRLRIFWPFRQIHPGEWQIASANRPPIRTATKKWWDPWSRNKRIASWCEDFTVFCLNNQKNSLYWFCLPVRGKCRSRLSISDSFDLTAKYSLKQSINRRKFETLLHCIMSNLQRPHKIWWFGGEHIAKSDHFPQRPVISFIWPTHRIRDNSLNIINDRIVPCDMAWNCLR